MLISDQLRQSLENLYAVFRDYPLRADTDACSCCHTKRQEQMLHLRPLRELRVAELRDYAFDALYTWGTEEDFKHFLPRLLELVVATNSPTYEYIDPPALFKKLPYASWWSWPDPEKTAVDAFLRATWDSAVRTPAEELDCFGIDDWLCSVAQVFEDLFPFFAAWLEVDTETAYRNLAHFIVEEYSFSRTSPPMGWWEGHEDQWRQIGNWLLSPSVKKKLERGVERWAGGDLGEELYQAVVLLG